MRRRLSLLAPFLAVLVAAGCTSSPAPVPADAEAIERNNAGVALMGQYRNEDARVVFAELAEAHPTWLDVRVNLAIAILNRQQDGDEAWALDVARTVLSEEPGHLRARYVAGLLELYLGNAERAAEDLAAVAAADPADAHAAYFHAQALTQLGRHADATSILRRAAELDPYLRSAYYSGALALRRVGDDDGARAMLGDYQKLEGNPRAHLAEFRYTRMGRKAEALALDPPQAFEVDVPEGPLFAPPQRLAGIELDPEGLSLTVADIDGDGRPDLFVAGGRGQGNRVMLARGDGFERAVAHPLEAVDDVAAALWGDIDNDGKLDVYLCRLGPNRMFLQRGDGWREVAAEAGVDDVGQCVDAALFDADHDGDLDIFVVNGDGPNELLSNNLDGTFRRLSVEAEPALAGGPRASRGMLVLDLEGDRDADIVVWHAQPPHQVLLNDRLWSWREDALAADFSSADAVAMSAVDWDGSGALELLVLDQGGALSGWRRDEAGWRSRLLVETGVEAAERPVLSLLDIDGDGHPELLLQHAGGFRVYGSDGSGGLVVRHDEHADLLALTPLLLDPESGPALAAVVAGADGPELLLWPPGTGRHAYLAIAPTGRSEVGEGMRSNASGIGTRMVLRVADRWTVHEGFDRHGAPGQSLQPVAFGLGGHARADFVELHWSDGVYQTEMALEAGRVHVIAEHQRQLSSCPVLFAWNGERFEFVSDLLGVAGLGFLLEPGRYAEPRPWEYFKFPDGSLAQRDGSYELRIGEPMEEIGYLDSAWLHVYDLPPGWNLTLDERMFTGGGPEPSGAPLFYRESSLQWPRRALAGGRDVTAEVRAVDGRAVDVGSRDPRFLGRLADDLTLTLEFDSQLDAPAGQRPVLVAHGWVEYPYSQTLFAAWQAGAEYRPPTLEAYADGHWQVVHESFGYPAGMPREMALPLDALPPRTEALRITSNLEIYWDALYVVHAETHVEAHQARLPPTEARQVRSGFAHRTNLDQRRPHYDYSERPAFWDTRHPPGLYTAFGDVLELLEATDDAFAIVGPGEELQLQFAAPAPPPAGWRRVQVLEVRGYARDMDMYTRDGGRVAPLPITPGLGDVGRRDELRERFQTRYQGGR